MQNFSTIVLEDFDQKDLTIRLTSNGKNELGNIDCMTVCKEIISLVLLCFIYNIVFIAITADFYALLATNIALYPLYILSQINAYNSGCYLHAAIKPGEMKKRLIEALASPVSILCGSKDSSSDLGYRNKKEIIKNNNELYKQAVYCKDISGLINLCQRQSSIFVIWTL